MSGKRNANRDTVRANADTKLGSQRVRLLPDSAEEEAAAFEAPQATELLDPAELPDAMKNLGIGQKREPEHDVDATITFDPAELLRDDPLPHERLRQNPPPGDRTLIADQMTDSEPSSKSSMEAGFASPLDDDALPAATDLLQLDRTLESKSESDGVSLDLSFPSHPVTLPENSPLSDGLSSLPSLPAPPPQEKKPSWLGNAKPVDLGRPQNLGASPFEDEKRSLPTGAFGPIDPAAAAAPESTPKKGKGCSVIFGLLFVVVVVGSGVGAAFALGAFDDQGLVATAEETAEGDAAPSKGESETATGEGTAPTATGEEAPGEDEAPRAAFVIPPANMAEEGTVADDNAADDNAANDNAATGTDTPNNTAEARAVPVGFVRVLDNTKTKLPELAETLQQSVLRQLSSSKAVDARPGPVRIGLLVELRLQSLKIPTSKPEGQKAINAEADCSLVVRPTPLNEDEAESRNAHAAIDSTLPLSTRLERGAVAAVAIAACGEALAADLVAYAGEHTIDWKAAEAVVAEADAKKERMEAAKEKKRLEAAKKKKRKQARKRRRRRRARK